jgi:hypothetical protein
MMRTSDFKPAPSEACVFHELACSFLTDQGFELANDPSRILGRYNASNAVYRSPRGLSLSVAFEPGDSNTAVVFFGREWSVQQEILFLSNYYPVLARRLGLDAPMFYKLGYGEQMNLPMKEMLADLRRTLPVVMSKVTLEDLLCIEREEFGAETKARIHLGPEYLQRVEISSFPVG